MAFRNPGPDGQFLAGLIDQVSVEGARTGVEWPLCCPISPLRCPTLYPQRRTT